jgi:hypothetical protein
MKSLGTYFEKFSSLCTYLDAKTLINVPHSEAVFQACFMCKLRQESLVCSRRSPLSLNQGKENLL